MIIDDVVNYLKNNQEGTMELVVVNGVDFAQFEVGLFDTILEFVGFEQPSEQSTRKS